MTLDTRDAPDPEEQPPRQTFPWQQTTLQAHIVRPEGRIYFAGEHCSLYHAWIQGALESGIRAAQEIHETP
jgi:monoamine oxidase